MSARILYIEDDARNMRVVRKYLAMAGHEIIEASDGMTGLMLAASQKPDLILVDINLPDINGMDITARIKADPELRDVPIIALTANAMFGDRERFLSAGCDGYLPKPVMYQELANTVTAFLAKSLHARGTRSFSR